MFGMRVATGGESEGASHWLAFLAYLAYLRSVRPPPSSEVVALRLLIVVVGLVLVALMLVVVGRPELVDEVLRRWPAL